jgi:hypothetical protein
MSLPFGGICQLRPMSSQFWTNQFKTTSLLGGSLINPSQSISGAGHTILNQCSMEYRPVVMAATLELCVQDGCFQYGVGLGNLAKFLGCGCVSVQWGFSKSIGRAAVSVLVKKTRRLRCTRANRFASYGRIFRLRTHYINRFRRACVQTGFEGNRMIRTGKSGHARVQSIPRMRYF